MHTDDIAKMLVYEVRVNLSAGKAKLIVSGAYIGISMRYCRIVKVGRGLIVLCIYLVMRKNWTPQKYPKENLVYSYFSQK